VRRDTERLIKPEKRRVRRFLKKFLKALLHGIIIGRRTSAGKLCSVTPGEGAKANRPEHIENSDGHRTNVTERRTICGADFLASKIASGVSFPARDSAGWLSRRWLHEATNSGLCASYAKNKAEQASWRAGARL
jgi:hypothetical protein